MLSQKVRGPGCSLERAPATQSTAWENAEQELSRRLQRKVFVCRRSGKLPLRGASPATLQKKKTNEQVRHTGVSLSVLRWRERLLSRTWLYDAPPKGSKLDGWGRGRFIFATRCAFEVLRWIWIDLLLGWGMLASIGKFLSDGVPIRSTCGVCWCTVWAWHLVFWVMCRNDGRWNTNFGKNCAAFRSGKRPRTVSFLSGAWK